MEGHDWMMVAALVLWIVMWWSEYRAANRARELCRHAQDMCIATQEKYIELLKTWVPSGKGEHVD